LWYPIIIASVSFVIGLIYINEKKTRHQDSLVKSREI